MADSEFDKQLDCHPRRNKPFILRSEFTSCDGELNKESPNDFPPAEDGSIEYSSSDNQRLMMSPAGSQFLQGNTVIKQNFLLPPSRRSMSLSQSCAQSHHRQQFHCQEKNGHNFPVYSACPSQRHQSVRPESRVEPEVRAITPDSTDMVKGEDCRPSNETLQTSTSQDEKKDGGVVKPPMSYIGLISKAILQSPDRRMNLGAIYNWMESNFSYFRQNSRGWRNSVRHNLSLNDCFIKAGRCEDGKGNYWTIHPENLDDFIRGDFRLRRRSRRRGRKGDVSRNDVIVKGSYPSPQPTASQMYIPASMPPSMSFNNGQQYVLQDSQPAYPPSYNSAYTMYETPPSIHPQSISGYTPWTQTGDPHCMDLVVPASGPNYNPTHLYGYANYSYPAFGYQSTQW